MDAKGEVLTVCPFCGNGMRLKIDNERAQGTVEGKPCPHFIVQSVNREARKVKTKYGKSVTDEQQY